jgi:hypothetical protein
MMKESDISVHDAVIVGAGHNGADSGCLSRAGRPFDATAVKERARSRARFDFCRLELSHVSQTWLFCAYQWGIDQMLAEEPNLQLVGPQYIAHDQIIGPFVSNF